MTNISLDKKANKALEKMVRTHLASKKGVNPSGVAYNEVIAALIKGYDETYLFSKKAILSTENGVKKKSMAIAFIDRDTGYHYNNLIINE